MKKMVRKSAKFIKRHRFVIGTIFLLTLLTATGNVWLYTVKHQEITKMDMLTQQKADEVTRIAQQNGERYTERVAREAADKAKNATASSAFSIDSKSCNTATSHNNPAAIDVIVNKKHCIQPLSYVPADLVSSSGATLSAKAIDAYTALYAAAAAAGQSFSVTSSYRSYGSQVATFNRWVGMSGLTQADTYSARPGYSEHQTGFAFDVAAGSCKLSCFGSTSQYTWLQKHAADYGFIQRYYKNHDPITGYRAEEWHYRYVGVEVAKDLKAKGIKTLEEYWKVSGGDYH